MKSLFAAFKQLFNKQLLIAALISILSFGTILTLIPQPSYAQIPINSKETGLTKEELTGRSKDAPLPADEKINRAYDYSEGAGLREEKRQEKYETTKPEVENESLLEKAKDFVQDITGQ
ncbi:MAG: hypothetical protein ACOC04_04810 [Halothece sp.]